MKPSTLKNRSWRRQGAPPPWGATRVGGFTLIELVVVVAIIVILAGLLGPVLSKARRAAHKTACKNRERQLAIAFLNYVDDNDEGFIPREGAEPYGEVRLDTWAQVKGKLLSTGQGRSSDDVWYNALPSIMGIKPASYYARLSSDVRSAFYSRRNPIQCPSARFPQHATKLSYPYALFSLSMNSQIIFPPHPTVKFARFEHSPNLVLFLDNLLEGEPRVDSAQESIELGQPSSFATRLSARHDGQVNLAFPDGRVESYGGAEVVDTRPGSILKGSVITNGPVTWEPE